MFPGLATLWVSPLDSYGEERQGFWGMRFHLLPTMEITQLDGAHVWQGWCVLNQISPSLLYFTVSEFAKKLGSDCLKQVSM